MSRVGDEPAVLALLANKPPAGQGTSNPAVLRRARVFSIAASSAMFLRTYLSARGSGAERAPSTGGGGLLVIR